MSIGGKFSFLPWVKNSLTRKATIRQNSLRPIVPVRVVLAVSGGGSSPEEVLRDVAVHGPGDVIGLQTEAVLKTTPVAGEQQYPASHLVSIEFGEEDLPWRYSPEGIPDSGPTSQQVAPWCFLLVLKSDEFTSLAQGSAPLPAISVADLTTAFPSSDSRWVWAHVQTNVEVTASSSAVEDFLETDLKANPDLAFSRVFSPRHLVEFTDYHAFLVPAYETGRLAGLGLPFPVDSTGQPEIGAGWCAWDTPASYTRPQPTAFPVYYQWEFRTSAAVDFEALARLLKPDVLVNFGTQPLSLTTPLSSASSTTPTSQQFVLDLPGVMQELGAPVMQTIPELQADLYKTILPIGSTPPPLRPIVTPPVYGRTYTSIKNLENPPSSSQSSTNWLRQVNLHPGYRAMAAIGTQVIQDNQEEYMQRAWEQVHDIIAANMNLRGMQSGLQTTSSLRSQHLPVFNTGSGSAAFRTAAKPSDTTSTDGSVVQRSAATTTTQMADPTDESNVTTTAAQEGEATQGLGMENYGLHLTALSLPRLMDPNTGQTLLETIRQSSMPLASFSPTFRRLLKPFGRYQTSLAGPPRRATLPPEQLDPNKPVTLLEKNQNLQQRDSLLALLADGTITAAPPKYPYLLGYQFDDVVIHSLFNPAELSKELELWVATPDGGYKQITGEEWERFKLAYDSFAQVKFVPEKDVELPPALDLAALKEAVIKGTDPKPVFLARANRAVSFLPHYQDNAETAPEAPSQGKVAARGVRTAARSATARPQPLQAVQPVMAYPVFKDPMGPLLQQRHPEMFLPNLGDFPANAVTLLEYNHAFVEAYMLGLNHAFGSELLWRDYPTDLRGSYFRQFWDVSEFLHTNPPVPATVATLAAQEEQYRDIRPIDEWGSRLLGKNRPTTAPDPSVLLAIRGELLKRYPNTVVCAAPAIRYNGRLVPDLSQSVYPIHRSQLGQDITLFSFILSASQLQGDSAHPDGYFFVLYERPGEPQFGLDYERDTSVSFSLWDDFAWSDLPTSSAGTNIKVSELTATGPAPGPDTPFTRVGTSAQFAYAVFQQPFLVAIRARDMMRPA
jgi:hypothetical protein